MSKLTQFFHSIMNRIWPSTGPTPIRAKWDRYAATPEISSKPWPIYAADNLTIEHFQRAGVFGDKIEQLFQTFQRAPLDGYVMEFGVYRGTTINHLAQWSSCRNDPRVFGFDSIEGLPEDWVKTEDGERHDAGHFALEQLPCVFENVTLIKGFFDQSLEPWLAQNSGPVAFLHNDSDLYSSTIYTLRTLNDRILPGTVIVFDELCDWGNPGNFRYDKWEEGEWKALREWMGEFDRRISILSRSQGHQAAIQVVR